MLIDDVTFTVKAGDGGNGAVTFHSLKVGGGPSGGNGAKGGDVYLIGTNDIGALSQFTFKKRFEAAKGENGSRQDMDGRNGEDLYLKVPIGTRISINDSDWIYEIEDTETPFLVAKGGSGGRGNDEFKSAINQTPRYAEKGTPGQEKKVHLELRLIAQIGLVGLPNAGKSSLLQAFTNANPKIGNYPFTTLEPNLGVMGDFILADIPGLIEGASIGKGLGTKFLRHIEKTQIIAHCIDVSLEKPLESYKTIRKEFEQYNPELLKKPEIIILTKTDLIDKKEITKKVKIMQKLHETVIPVSIIDDESIKKLREVLLQKLTNQ
jgi:GTP-binding protein